MTSPPPDPTNLMQLGMGFFGSRTLLSAVELECGGARAWLPSRRT